jgi:hypothetical protein
MYVLLWQTQLYIIALYCYYAIGVSVTVLCLVHVAAGEVFGVVWSQTVMSEVDICTTFQILAF